MLLLADLGASIVDLPFLVVATERTGERGSPQLDDAIEQVRRLSSVRALSALEHDDVASLIRSAGIEPDEHMVDLIMARTGGNPLFVTELLRAMLVSDTGDRRIRALTESVPAA